MDMLWQDLRYAARMLARSPGFTAAAVVTLAVGIGANTAMFSVVYAVMLRPLPYAEPDRLARIRGGSSFLDLKDLTDQNRTFDGFAGYRSHFLDLTGAAVAERVDASLVTGDVFRLLGASAARGRVLKFEDDRPGGEKVVLISHGFWQRRLSSDPGAVGRNLIFASGSYRIVGVMPLGFTLPEVEAEVWVPVNVESPEETAARGAHTLFGFGRLKDGASLPAAQADLDGIARRLAQVYPAENKDRRYLLMPLQQFLVRDVRAALLLLLGAVAFVLLIATTNVANLLLARAASREREMAIRASLGAGGGRLLRQLLAESVLLATIGGFAGLLIAGWTIELVVRLAPQGVPGLAAVSLNGRVLAFTAAVALLTGIVFGLAPGLHVSGVHPGTVLREGGRVTEGPARHRLRSVLVVSEMALALVLLVGAGLLLRSFHRLQSVDPGFDPRRLLTFDLTLPMERYRDIPKRTRVFNEALARISALPGVEAVGATNELPFGRGFIYHNFVIQGRPPMEPGTEPEIYARTVSPGYFDALGVPIRRGRPFAETDTAEAPQVAIVNEAAVRAHFAGQDPIGQHVAWARAKKLVWIEIVGVVADVRASRLDAEEVPAVYTPLAQEQAPWKTWMNVVVRSSLAPAALVPAVQREVSAVDKDLPVTKARLMEELIAASFSSRRFNLVLLGSFAALALLLAAVGIHGVIAYSVAQRTHEVGLRMALGAERRDIVRLVVGQGLALTATGVALGSAGAVGLTRYVSGLLFGVRATDPLTFLAVAALLSGVAVVACVVPARRAMNVDPMVALRYE